MEGTDMFLLLFCVWVILNGRITMEICILGILVSAAIFAFLCRFLDYSVKKELLLFRLFPLFVRYLWVLVEEIVKANVCVLKIILSPELQPEPAVVYFDTRLRSGIARVMLADSITLTPGTITVSLEGNHYCVHCLDRELAQGLEDSVFVELLEEMENKVWKQLNMPTGV
jgi:multicomponent Na+:H+ antiporter subunit E